MRPKTHDQIAAELQLQLKTLGSLLPLDKLGPFDATVRLRDIERLAVRTFASQLWLCENAEEIRKQVDINRAGAGTFYLLAEHVVKLFCATRDLAKVNFSGWGHYSLLSDAVVIYLKEIEK